MVRKIGRLPVRIHSETTRTLTETCLFFLVELVLGLQRVFSIEESYVSRNVLCLFLTSGFPLVKNKQCKSETKRIIF